MTPDLAHFTGLAAMSAKQLRSLLDLTRELITAGQPPKPKLLNRIIITLFYEPSTRTRSSFSIAAYRLGAQIIDLVPGSSSIQKGESWTDTFLSLQAMGADLLVLRHNQSGLVRQLTEHLAIPLVNAGDGTNEHPSQTLLDLVTILLHRGETQNLKIALVGDIKHSRVANSFIQAMAKLGCGELCLIGPPELLDESAYTAPYITIQRNMDQGLKNADVIIMLRVQRERIEAAVRAGGLLSDAESYFSAYGLSRERLKWAKPDALIMHPGPINHGVEISSAVVDGPNSLILKQVEYGVAARMAIFLSLLDTACRQRVWG